METDNIDCEGTAEIVCPYCGYEFEQSWEYVHDEPRQLNIECDECNKKFDVVCEYSVNFTSYKNGE